jgi:endonuclease YncB( thermonuclease family)
MNSIKHIGPVALVCFCALAWLKAAPVFAQCSLLSALTMDQALPWSGQPLVGKTYKLDHWLVQDGDSLSLPEGHRLRLGHINTTEMASKGRPTQAYAEQGKAWLKQQLKQQPVIYVQLLPEVKDRYGRWLVKLYDGVGSNLEASLVAQGLAYVISMDGQGAPRCLWQQEIVARKQGLGLWQASLSRVRDAALLTPRQGGFMRLGGVVTDISQSQRYWYIGLEGQVAVKIAKKVLAASRLRIDSAQQLKPWIGQNITARGWLAWRKLSKKQHKKGFKAGVMSLYHLHMLEQAPNLGSY